VTVDRSSQPRLDPRRPLVLDTRELGRRAGSLRRVQRSVPAPEDLRLELIGVPPGALLALDLRLEAVMEGVLVSGTVTAPLAGECGRCLEQFDDEVTTDLQELYVYPGERTTGEDADELPQLVGDLLDLEPALRDAVVLDLPLTPLCEPDCPGLCATCGERLADSDAGHDHDAPLDPRWAAVAHLLQPDADRAASRHLPDPAPYPEES